MNKVIIAFIGNEGVGKTEAANALVKLGAYRISINDQVSEIAKHLVDEDAMLKSSKKIIHRIRQRGYMVHNGYWLNMVLVTVPDKENFIVIDDAWVEDVSNKIIKPYQIVRPGVTTKAIPNITIIPNDGDIAALCEQMKILHKRFAK
ncbi:MAG: hypothetical protein WC375_11805 [Methanomassiliicoccales archaeon]|jgi:ABC-type sugar transport system ATPase subunit